MLQGDTQPFENMGAGLGLAQFKFGAAANDLAAMLNKNHQRPLEAEQTRLVIDQSQTLHPKGGLQSRKFIKAIEHAMGLSVTLQFNYHPHPIAVALIAQIANFRNAFIPHQFSNTLDQQGFVYLIWQLGNDDLRTVATCPLHIFDGGNTAHHNPPASGSIGLLNPFAPNHNATRRKIWPSHNLGQVLNRHINFRQGGFFVQWNQLLALGFQIFINEINHRVAQFS